MTSLPPDIINFIASQGQDGDTLLGHLTKGDIVIPAEAPDAVRHVALQGLAAHGLDPNRFTAGSPGNQINDNTGIAAFADGGDGGDGGDAGGNGGNGSDGGNGQGANGSTGGEADSADHSSGADDGGGASASAGANGGSHSGTAGGQQADNTDTTGDHSIGEQSSLGDAGVGVNIGTSISDAFSGHAPSIGTTVSNIADDVGGKISSAVSNMANNPVATAIDMAASLSPVGMINGAINGLNGLTGANNPTMGGAITGAINGSIAGTPASGNSGPATGGGSAGNGGLSSSDIQRVINGQTLGAGATAGGGTGGLNPNNNGPSSSNVGQGILPDLTDQASAINAVKGLDKGNEFAPGYGQDIISQILQQQYGQAQQGVQNSYLRGTLSDIGLNSADQALTGQQSKALSTLDNLANPLAASYQQKLNQLDQTLLGQAGNTTASNPFNINQATTQFNNLKSQLGGQFQGDILNQIPSLGLFDLPSLIAAGGNAQGLYNPGGTGYSPIMQALSNQRGIGTQGAF